MLGLCSFVLVDFMRMAVWCQTFKIDTHHEFMVCTLSYFIEYIFCLTY